MAASGLLQPSKATQSRVAHVSIASLWLPEMKHPFLLRHPPLPWILDATVAGVSIEALDALPWDRVFRDMEALESGAIANPDEDRQVGHYWLRDPMLAPTVGQARQIGECTDQIVGFADELRSGVIRARDGHYTDLLWIGIGGSALGPLLLLDACADGGLRPWFLDNVDPEGVEHTLRQLGDRLRTTLVCVASKSGTTPEPMACLALVRERLAELGADDPSRLVAVTGPGSTLAVQAEREGWRAVFETWDWVGGRTSATSATGLLPTALCGIDPLQILAGARDMDTWTRTPDWRDNPAALLAGCWMVLGKGKGDRAMAVIPYRDRLATLSRYLQQLVMESIGKRHDLDGNTVNQGLTVYGNKGSTDQHAYVQQLRDGRDDSLALLVQVLDDGEGSATEVAEECDAGDLLQGFLLGTRRALASDGRPVILLTAPTLDAHAMGAVIALFERAVGFYGSMLNINAYHQPGVEAGKRAARDLLALSRRIRASATGVAVSAEAIAEQLGADPVETWYVCERLVQTRRLARDGDDPPRYRTAKGHER